ncbi:hypothetical protein [Bradyrhizobium sp. SZCCHNPS1003]|uniref:hypothetical protein n=1 Tax=Bradyrhizobium sp. SZCCHNPS1003 TaxID=3057330 RepID=UPI0028F045F5|nr:hypothetical protein [Bradyrhizobium sp. SZCCHNPS1003]
MAKDSRKSAGTNGAEKTGATLSGLFADENEFDRRALWRLGWWGAGAVGAVGLAVFTNQAAQGWRQDRVSAADLSRQAQLLQSLARETQGEARQLGAAIETLNTDRDRLYARVTVLEQGLDSVTGALAKQSAQATANPAPGGKAAPAPQIAAVESQATVAAPSSSAASSPLPAYANASPFMPIPNGAAGINPAQPGSPAAAASADKTKQEQSRPMSAGLSGASSSSVSAALSPTPPAPAVAATGSQPPGGAPDPAGKPAETDKLAKAEPAEAGAKGNDSTDVTVTAVQKTEFAVDLGAASSLGGLRALWRDLVKTHADLASLRPIIILKEGRSGPGMQLRLGAGPLGDAATAAKICAVLAESRRACETTVYDGQRLAVREEPEGAEAAKPGAPAAAAQKPVQRRRTFQPQVQQQRHGKREEPPPTAAAPAPPPAEAPKPEQPSALSSFFRRS